MNAAKPSCTAPDERVPMVCCTAIGGFWRWASGRPGAGLVTTPGKPAGKLPRPPPRSNGCGPRTLPCAKNSPRPGAKSPVGAESPKRPPGNAPPEPRRARPRSRPISGVGSCSVAIRTATAAVYRLSKPPVGCWSIGHESPRQARRPHDPRDVDGTLSPGLPPGLRRDPTAAGRNAHSTLPLFSNTLRKRSPSPIRIIRCLANRSRSCASGGVRIRISSSACPMAPTPPWL